MTELESLKIDRSGSRRRRSGRRRGGWGRWVALALLAAGLWLFRAPLVERIDRLRLPEVNAIEVRKTSALAASAASGTAANGYIVAAVRAALSADTPGRIVEMNVTEGSVVREGEVVARLYSDEYEADLRKAEAELVAAGVAVERAEADRASSEARIEQLEAEVGAAAASVDEAAATAKLAELNLTRAERLLVERVQSEQARDEALAERDRAAAARLAADGKLAAARAAVNQARVELAAREAAVAEARSAVPAITAARDRARATLEKTEVRAPFDGVVVLKDAEVGEVVSPNAVGSQSRGSVVTMVDFASLEVQVEVPETSLAAVRLGAPTRIYVDAYPEAPYAGHVARIWPTANRQKATVEVRVAIEAPDERLRPEMGVRAVFEAEQDDTSPQEAETTLEAGILIPRSCVLRLEGRWGVFVLEQDVARFREVDLGDETGGRVLVRGGLEEGDRVVTDPPPSLTDGDRVVVAGT